MALASGWQAAAGGDPLPLVIRAMAAVVTPSPLGSLTAMQALVTDPSFPRHGPLWSAVAAGLPEAELAHDAAHVARVYRWCLRLAPEAGADADLAGACGLVHDAVVVPKHLPDRPLGGERSAELAAGLLPEAGYSAAETAAVVEAVRTCSWSRGLAATSPLGQLLQDADRLDALGVVGFMRTIGCHQDMATAGATAGGLYHPADPFAAARELDDRRWAIDHLPAKLLRLAASMHYPTAKAEAALRHAVLEGLLDDLRRELTA